MREVVTFYYNENFVINSSSFLTEIDIKIVNKNGRRIQTIWSLRELCIPKTCMRVMWINSLTRRRAWYYNVLWMGLLHLYGFECNLPLLCLASTKDV